MKHAWENGAGLRQLEDCSFLKGRSARPESWQLIWMDVEDDVGAGALPAARAGRVVVLHKGSVALDGTPQEVFSRTDVLHSIGLAAPETVELCFALREAGYQLPLTALDTENCAQALFDFVKA